MTEIGPRFDLVLRRSKIASPEDWKHAVKQPKGAARPPSVKNVSRDNLGNRVGRLHPEGQDLSKIQLRKTRAIKKIQSDKRAEKKAQRKAERTSKSKKAT